MKFRLCNEEIELLPERAIWWPRNRILFISDLHLGKTETFHSASIAIPFGSLEIDLTRLTNLIQSYQPLELCILGDFLHSRAGRSKILMERLDQWFADYESIRITLVRGNHDRGSGDPPERWRVACLDEPQLYPPFALKHYPEACESGYVLSGHLHPGVVLSGPAKQKLKLPCFWIQQSVCVLPAFGSFTGSARIQPQKGDRIFAIAENEIVEIPY